MTPVRDPWITGVRAERQPAHRQPAQAFANSSRRDYRHVAVVDDTVTTGSTISEITRLLHRGGVEYVEILALARAYHS